METNKKLELVFKTEGNSIPSIEFGFTPLKAKLEKSLEQYKNFVVTEENLEDAKAAKKELVAGRTNLETFRKATKKPLVEAGKKFDGECNVLSSLIDEVEKPLTSGLDVFTQKKKDEKIKIAKTAIEKAIEKFNLEPKYAKELLVKDFYSLSATTQKAIKEDVEKEAMELFNKQEAFKTKIAQVEVVISTINTTMSGEILLSDVQYLIDADASFETISTEINNRATRLKEAEARAIEKAKKEMEEKLAKEEAARIQKEKDEALEIERAAAAAQSTIEVEEVCNTSIQNTFTEMAKEPVPEFNPIFASETMLVSDDTAKKTVETPVVAKETSLFYLELKVEGTSAELKSLNEFLVQNSFDYEIMKQYKVGAKVS